MSMKALKSALKNKIADEFEVGTVIRWTSSGTYTYAAIKSPVGWFTTARDYNTYVPQQVTFDQLVKILQRAETTEIEVATEWQEIA